MIAMTDRTTSISAPTGATARAATSPRPSGLSRAAVTPLRPWGGVCPQTPAARSLASAAPADRTGDVRVAARSGRLAAVRLVGLGIAPAGLGIEKAGETTVLSPATQHVDFDTHYGTTPHHSGTRVRKPPI